MAPCHGDCATLEHKLNVLVRAFEVALVCSFEALNQIALFNAGIQGSFYPSKAAAISCLRTISE